MSSAEAYKRRLEEKLGKKPEEKQEPGLQQAPPAEVPAPSPGPATYGIQLRAYRTIKGHTGAVTSAVFSPDDKYIVSGSTDGTVRSWNPLTGAPVSTFSGKDSESPSHAGPVNCVRVFPDNKYAASASDDVSVKLWDIRTGKEAGVLGHGKELESLPRSAFTSLSVSPDRRFLAAGTAKGYVHIWDVKSSRTKPVYHQSLELGSPVSAVSFSPGSVYLAVGRKDSPVALFELDAKKGQYLDRHDLSDPSGQNSLDAFMFSRKGDALVQAYAKPSLSGPGVEALSFWSVSDRPLPASSYLRVERPAVGTLSALAFYAKDTVLLSGGSDGYLRAWDLELYTPVGEALGHDTGIACLAVSSNEELVATGSSDKTLKLWKVKRV